MFMNSPLLPSSLEGAWVEVMKAGDYGDRGRWTDEQLDQLAATYDPRRHAAPVVLGHPADDAPAYAWVRRLRRAGQSLWAQLEKVDPALDALLRAGRFAQRSVALYTRFPVTGGPYLRHLGFLGAAPPAVKGLAPVRPARRSLGVGGFADAPTVSFAFDNEPCQFAPSPVAPATGTLEVAMPEPKSKLEAFLNHLRAFFTTDPPNKDVIPSDSEGSAFAERLAALEHRLTALSSKEGVTPSDPESEGRGGVEGSLLARQQATVFVESLRSQGRFPPTFDRWGVVEFMERLAVTDSRASSNEHRAPEPEVATSADPKPDARSTMHENSLLSWFHDFLTQLPAVIEFRELGTEASHRSPATGHRSPVVRFTEPRRGMTIDPASVELAERAEALAAELNITYADALARLREEARRTPTTA